MIFTNHIPNGPLNKYVECLFHFQGYQPDHSIERLVPDGSINVIIELDNKVRYVYHNDTLKPKQQYTKAWLSGMHRGFITLSALPGSELFVIRFKPGGSYPFLKIPIEQINDMVVNAEEVIGDKILDLRSELLKIRDAEDKLNHGEKWLSDHFDFTLEPDEVVWNAVNNIISDPSFAHSNLQKIVDASGYSPKQFIHLFKKFVGPTPKYFQRIFRFNEVLHKVHQKKRVNWTQVGLDCGYFDQAHLIKDFRQFSGLKPQEFMNQQHERLNFFPVD